MLSGKRSYFWTVQWALVNQIFEFKNDRTLFFNFTDFWKTILDFIRKIDLIETKHYYIYRDPSLIGDNGVWKSKK